MEKRFGPPSRATQGRAPADPLPRTYLEPPGSDGGGGLDAETIKAFLFRRKWTILAGFFGVLLLVAVVTFLLPATYESTASFLVERQQQGGGSEALAVLERMGQVRNTETEVELIQGRRTVEPVVDSLDLHVGLADAEPGVRPGDLFSGFTATRSAEPGTYEIRRQGGEIRVEETERGGVVARGAPGSELVFSGIQLVVPADTAAVDRTLRVLPFSKAVSRTQKRITAEPAQRQADLVQLTCSGSTAESARTLCRAVQRSYLALRSELQRAEAATAADFLEGQAEQIRQRLAAAEDSLQEYQVQNQAVALEERASEGVRNFATLQARYSELTAERNALGSLIEEIESGDPGISKYRELASFPTFLQNNQHIVSELVESLVELENRRSELGVRRTGENPELAAVNDRIQEIEGQLLNIAKSYRQSLSAQIRSLEQEIQGYERELATIPERQVETARLQRRVTMLEDLYKFLQTRLQEAEVAEAVTLPSVRVVDRPSLPHEPAFPNTRLNLALGAILGLGTGLLGGLWREYTDDTLRDRGEIEEAGIPVLSMVPRVKDEVITVDTSGQGKPRLRPPDRSRRDGGDQEVAAEAFRTLAFELDSAARWLDGRKLSSVAITSASRAEGKTFCACNLAVQAALLGKRTLLVDADFRARGVGRWLGLPRGRAGLLEILQDGGEPTAAIETIGIGEEAELSVLPSGSEPDAGPRLLADTLGPLVDRLRADYDLLVVDTPPLNVLSDAAQVATSVDGVAVVVRGGVTAREGLELTIERLERVGAELVGVVLNDVALPEYYTSYSRADDHVG